MMNVASGKFRSLVAAAMLLVPMAVPAADAPRGSVQVAYSNPEQFADVGDNRRVTTDARRDALLEQLTRHIQEHAGIRIPTDSTLVVTVTDIDMAGGFEWWRAPHADRVRIVRDVYPPRIKLEFRLTGADRKVIAEGRRDLTDLSFMTNMEYRSDLLRYEKKLLDDWFAREFTGQPSRHAENR